LALTHILLYDFSQPRKNIEDRASKPDGILKSSQNVEHFKKYTDLLRVFLTAHHHHEDDLIFVRVSFNESRGWTVSLQVL